MIADTPAGVKCTTFSILFSRIKGELTEAARGAAVIDTLKPGDKVLIAEACSHHAIEDDIGRVKIPRWLRQYTGADSSVDVCSGTGLPGKPHGVQAWSSIAAPACSRDGRCCRAFTWPGKGAAPSRTTGSPYRSCRGCLTGCCRRFRLRSMRYKKKKTK